MSHVISIKDSSLELTVTCSADSPEHTANASLIVAFGEPVRAWFAAVPMVDLSFKRDAANLQKYVLQFEHLDGRKWKQNLFFSGMPDTDPAMTFAVGDAWRLAELILHLEVRLALIALRNGFDATEVKAVRP